MRPEKLKSKIFLDGGNPEETKEILDKLGFLDGQTTNPSLVAKNPDVKKRFEEGNFFSKEELIEDLKDEAAREKIKSDRKTSDMKCSKAVRAFNPQLKSR